jgi:hypothetical protein
MKTYIKILAAMSALALVTAAQANTVGGVTATLAGNNGTSWLGAPVFATFPNPNPFANPGGAFSAENNYGSSQTLNEPYGNGGLAQSFVLPTTVTLTDLQFAFGGSPYTGMGIALYDLGPAGGYTVSTTSNFLPSYNGGGADLLPAGLQFDFSGGATEQTADLQFSGTPITLNANEEYAVALEPSTSPINMLWYRSGAVGTPSYGQAYRYATATWAPNGSYTAINGGIREFGLAVNKVGGVPEPTIMALMGAGIALTGMMIRRRKA